MYNISLNCFHTIAPHYQDSRVSRNVRIMIKLLKKIKFHFLVFLFLITRHEHLFIS